MTPLEQARREVGEGCHCVDCMVTGYPCQECVNCVSMWRAIHDLELAAASDALFALVNPTAADLGAEPTHNYTVSEARDLVDRAIKKAELAARLEQAEKMLTLATTPLDPSGRIGINTDLEGHFIEERDRIRREMEEETR